MAAPDPAFADFLRRIRAGDEQADAELLRRYAVCRWAVPWNGLPANSV